MLARYPVRGKGEGEGEMNSVRTDGEVAKFGI